MVLSNKKLKKKLRTLRTESLAEAELLGGHAKDALAASELEIVKHLLASKTQQPSFLNKLKKPKKKKKPKEHIEDDDTHKEVGDEASKEEDGIKEGEEDGGVTKTAKQNKKDRKKKKDWWEIKKEKKRRKLERTQNEANVENVEDSQENGHHQPTELQVVESEENAKKVYVGGIPYYSSEDDIRSFFDGCGTITDVDCMKFPETGKFRGIAILTFKTDAAAKRALALDGADMGGFYLKIQPYKSIRTQKPDFAPEVVEGYNRIYIGNLSWDITEDDLKKLLTGCKISSIRWGTDKETAEFKGYAHVDFSDSSSLTKALKLDQKIARGRPVRIRCALPKNSGENSNKRPRDKPHETNTSNDELADNISSGNLDVNDNEVEDDTNGGNKKKKKKKRRTCYECGVPGHLSSSCPKRKAVEVGSAAI